MKKNCVLIVMAILAGLSSHPAPAAPRDQPLALIPWPASVERQAGAFALKDGTALVVPIQGGADFAAAAELWAAKLADRHGVRLSVVQTRPMEARTCPPGMIITSGPDGCTRAEGAIVVEMSPAFLSELPPERAYQAQQGYRLEVGTSIRIMAGAGSGLHNALMTVLQLVEPGAPPQVPAVTIIDYPRFSWRGMLLDSSRSFEPPEVIKSYIDRLSELKLNVFHWHIVDDQGWRIESKVWPRLHEVGGTLAAMNTKKRIALDKNGWGADGRGYYTQDELREIVAYAAARHVMIVPEIDIPGHSSAMQAAYPELTCSGEAVPVRHGIGIFPSALCPGKENVYEFLDILFAELVTIFPAPYVHIGSDEVMAKEWMSAPANQELIAKYGYTDNAGLQSYFVKRVSEILKKHGRTMIAWDEVTDYAPEGTVIQAWRKQDYARVAAEKGLDSIISPVTHCYIDYPQLSFTLKNLYSFEPIPAGLDPKLLAHIKGGEVNLWGERVTLDNIDKKAFPRVIAHAEVMWSPADARDWDQFLDRLRPIKKDLKKRGTKFGKTWRDLLLLP
jgi:hexosaminidase